MHLCQNSTDVVVAFFEIFNRPLRLAVVPAVVNDDEAQIKTATELKQSVGLVLGPVLVVQVLMILEVRVGRYVNRLMRNVHITINLAVPRSRTTTYGQTSFSVSGPSLWNSLPLSVTHL